MYPPIPRVHIKKKKKKERERERERSGRDLSNDANVMFLCCFLFCRHIDAIQMGTHNICLCKESRYKYTGCNLKTMELLDCAYRGMCSN